MPIFASFHSESKPFLLDFPGCHGFPTHSNGFSSHLPCGLLLDDDLQAMKGQEGLGVIVAGKGQDVLQLGQASKDTFSFPFRAVSGRFVLPEASNHISELLILSPTAAG